VTVFDPVPDEDFRRTTLATVEDLLRKLESDTRNALLTLARIWTSVETGRILSKDAAATWALARLPGQHRPVLERARAIYLGEEDERWDDVRDDVAACAGHLRAEIERTRPPVDEPSRTRHIQGQTLVFEPRR
jgi:streptomycin 3"-adenylyltransferase